MATSTQTAQAPNANRRKRSRDPLIAEKQKVFDFVKNSGATSLNDLLASNEFAALANGLAVLVNADETSVAKDHNKAESYIASGCAVFERKQSRGAGKPRKKDLEDAATLIHKGLMLMPTLLGDAGNPAIEKTLESAYKALAQIYNGDNLKNQARFEMYSMLWLRQCAPKYTDRRHLVEVQYNAQALFESYGRTMKNYMKRLASMGQSGTAMHRQMGKLVAEIRRVRAKAEECLLAEAIADFQTRPRLFSILLSQYKEIKSTLSRDFSVFDSFQLQSPLEFNKEKEARLKAALDPAQASGSKKAPSPVTNILVNVLLDFTANCLRARRTLTSGRVIFYEPVIASNWATASHHCGQCCKPLPFGGVPCPKCSRVSFCTERCLFFTQDSSSRVPVNRHGDLSCANYKGFKLSKSSALLYDLLTKSSTRIVTLATAILEIGNELNIKPLSEGAFAGDLALNMLVVLICKRAAQLNASNSGAMPIDPWLAAEALHLTLIFDKFPEFKTQVNQKSMVIFLYKLLFYFKISPQANVYLDRSKGGIALGAFGGGMLEYSCLPNTRRQLNPKTGFIEYVALRKIEPGEVLTVARSSKNKVSKGRQLKAELDKYMLTCSCNKCAQTPQQNTLQANASQ